MRRSLLPKRWPSSRLWAALLVLARLVALVLAMQVGGLVHGLADVVEAAAGVVEESEQCPLDGSCNDCPPACPNCHCANASVSLSGVQLLAVQPAPVHSARPPACRNETQAPPSPDPSSVFRPPRDSRRS